MNIFFVSVKPTSIRVLDATGTQVTNATTLGPLTEGTQIRLECIVNGGRPTPKLTWTLRGKEIQGEITTTELDSDSGPVVTNTIQLVLTRAELGAVLQCEVVSDALDAPVRIVMDIDVNLRPTKISVSGVEGHAVQGSKVTLECMVQGARPAANLTWYNGSKPIEAEQTLTTPKLLADGTYDTLSSLSFWATRFENGRAFRCEAENLVSRQESERPLHATKLLEILYPPLASVRPDNITVNETADVLLFCEYEANPASLTSVTWIQNGRDLNLGAEPWHYEGGTTEQQALLIRNSSSKDLGSFACKLSNAVGTSISPTSIYVDIHFKPEVKVWMEPGGPIVEGDKPNVTLHCEVTSGNPPTLARAKWFLDGELLKQLPDCNQTKEKEDSPIIDVEDMCEDIDPSRLLLQQAGRGFHGNYTCQGGNSAGWGPVSEPSELLVYYEPGPATLTYSPTRVVKGQTLTLTCTVEDFGRPAATRFRWFRGSRVVADVITPTWTIDPVSLETAANFTCRAVNEAGMGGAATVSIQVLAPPAFINNFPPYTGALFNSDSISLSCRVECWPPCSVQWLKDGRLLPAGAPYKKIDNPIPPDTRKNDFQSLHSQLVWELDKWPGGVLDRVRDNANYTCRSSDNSAGGGVTCSTVFRVEYPPENITVSNNVVSVTENNIPEKVTCYAKGRPEPSFTWKKSNSSQGKDNGKPNGPILGKGQTLVLDRAVQRSDSGDLICEASNKHGSTYTTTYLNVMYKPECGITQKESEGYQELVCTANANPTEVTFSWRLKNENDTMSPLEFVRQKGLQSILRLDPSVAGFRTYLCVASNQVGSGVPCERDVAGGGIPWWRRWEQDPLVLVILAAIVPLILLLLICIPLFCYCHKRKSNKCAVSGNGVGQGEEADTYQNLSFHGLQHATHIKNTNLHQQQFNQNNYTNHSSLMKMDGKKQFQLPLQKNRSFCYFQSNQDDNQCENNHVQTLPDHSSYDPQFYSKTLDRTKDKGRSKSSRMKKSESLREKLSCVGSHSTDSFDRRNCRGNLNEYLNSETPSSYFQHLLKSHNQNSSQNYPPSYSYTISSVGNHRHSTNRGGLKDKGHKKQIYTDLALSNHNMKFKNTVHSNRQLYGNFALVDHEINQQPINNDNGSLTNNNQRKASQGSKTEQNSIRYNEIDV